MQAIWRKKEQTKHPKTWASAGTQEEQGPRGCIRGRVGGKRSCEFFGGHLDPRQGESPVVGAPHTKRGGDSSPTVDKGEGAMRSKEKKLKEETSVPPSGKGKRGQKRVLIRKPGGLTKKSPLLNKEKKLASALREWNKKVRGELD